MVKQTKAEKAAILIANEKIDRANAFYLYHKEIIDEFYRLQKEASDARFIIHKIRINRINRGDFDL